MKFYKYFYVLFFIFLLACNANKKETILLNETLSNTISTDFITDTLNREELQGIWIRKDYLEAIGTEKSPLKAYSQFGDFFLIRIYTYNHDFCIDKQYFFGKEEVDEAIIEYTKKYENNKEVEVELLGDFNAQEIPVELSIFLDSIDKKGYKVHARNWKTDSFNTLRENIKFVHGEGILNFNLFGESYKDSVAKKLSCHIRFKKSEMTFSVYQDSSFWEYKFIKVGSESYGEYSTFKLIPDEVVNVTVNGTYNLFDSDNKLVSKDVILRQNGNIINWNLYKHFKLTLAYSDVAEWGQNTDLMYMFKEHPDKIDNSTYNRDNRVDYIMEREGVIIKLYNTIYEPMERIAYYKKAKLAYELRPVYKNLSVVPM